jgi:hypothetical protein
VHSVTSSGLPQMPTPEQGPQWPGQGPAQLSPTTTTMGSHCCDARFCLGAFPILNWRACLADDHPSFRAWPLAQVGLTSP